MKWTPASTITSASVRAASRAKRQAVADDVGDRVEDVRGLIIVRQDDRVALALQLAGSRRCPRPGSAIRRAARAAPPAGRARAAARRRSGHRGSGLKHGHLLHYTHFEHFGVRKSRAGPARHSYAAYENKARKARSSRAVIMRRPARSRRPGAGRSSSTSRRKRTSRAGRPPVAALIAAGLLDQPLLLDEPAEILLVQPHAGQRLDRALQLQQGESGRHQLEDDRPVFDLAAQPADRGREDPAMVGCHMLRRKRGRPAAARAVPGRADALDQARLRRGARSARGPAPRSTPPRRKRGPTSPRAAAARPRSPPCLPIATSAALERRERRRFCRPPILPRKIAIPALPLCLGGAGRAAPRARARDRRRSARGRARLAGLDAIAVAEGIELLDIAEPLAGLPFDPGAQTDFEGAMLDFQRAGRQCLDRLRPDAAPSDARLVDRRRNDGRTQPDRQRCPATVSRGAIEAGFWMR